MLKEGFNEDISNADYHSDREYVSSSGLKLILEDPRAFEEKYVLGEEGFSASASMDYGSYVHARILEPHLIDSEFAVYPGAMRRGKEWEQFQDENEGKILLTNNQKNRADAAVELFNASKVWCNGKLVDVKSFFQGGWAEQTLCGKLGGLKIKVRFDYRKEFSTFGSINDIKTTGFPIDKREDMEEVCRKWGYALSAALYVDLVSKYTGKPHNFYFCFIGSNKVKLVRASEKMLNHGRQQYKKAISILKRARKTGEYYPRQIEEIDGF